MRLRKKISVLAAATVMPLFVMPDAMAGVACQDNVMAQDDKHVNDGSLGKDDWYFKMVVKYRYCLNTAGDDWVKDMDALFHYNWEGSSMNCGWDAFQRLQKVTMNPYMWDKHGHNHNPGAVTLPCEEDTTSTVHQHYVLANMPRLHMVEGFKDGRPYTWFPHFKAEVTVYRDGILNDGHMATLYNRYHRVLVIDF